MTGSATSEIKNLICPHFFINPSTQGEAVVRHPATSVSEGQAKFKSIQAYAATNRWRRRIDFGGVMTQVIISVRWAPGELACPIKVFSLRLS
jgi:hypothetical protein